MSDKIVPLRGGKFVIPEETEEQLVPDPDVVEMVEDMLSAAKAGKLVGLAGVAVYHDDSICQYHMGACISYEVLGMLYVLPMKLGVQLVEDDEDDD